MAGTIPYMAPELLRGAPANVRSDLYAAGAVLYEMAAGRRLFRECSGTVLISAILEKNPVPPRTYNRRISAGLERIILRALDKEPQRRYQSSRELHNDLARLGTRLPSVAQRGYRLWTLLLDRVLPD